MAGPPSPRRPGSSAACARPRPGPPLSPPANPARPRTGVHVLRTDREIHVTVAGDAVLVGVAGRQTHAIGRRVMRIIIEVIIIRACISGILPAGPRRRVTTPEMVNNHVWVVVNRLDSD